jgi:hypothetical protein
VVGERYEAVINTMLELCRKIDNGMYDVHDGMIDWADYDFSKPGLAVMSTEGSFLRAKNYTVITLDMGARIPEELPQGKIDRKTQRNMMNQALRLFMDLGSAADAAGDSIILKTDTLEDIAIMWADTTLKAQGVTVSVKVEF